MNIFWCDFCEDYHEKINCPHPGYGEYEGSLNNEQMEDEIESLQGIIYKVGFSARNSQAGEITAEQAIEEIIEQVDMT